MFCVARWGTKYGVIVRLWENAWQEFIPLLDYDVEIRTVICSTNAIESLNARSRRVVRARGHSPTVCTVDQGVADWRVVRGRSWTPVHSDLWARAPADS